MRQKLTLTSGGLKVVSYMKVENHLCPFCWVTSDCSSCEVTESTAFTLRKEYAAKGWVFSFQDRNAVCLAERLSSSFSQAIPSYQLKKKGWATCLHQETLSVPVLGTTVKPGFVSPVFFFFFFFLNVGFQGSQRWSFAHFPLPSLTPRCWGESCF